MRKLTTVIILFIFFLNARAQNISSVDSIRKLIPDLKKTTTDNERLKVLIKLGSYYLYKPGELKSDLDSADLYLGQAKELGAKLKLSKIQNKVPFLQAEVIFEREDHKGGDELKARTAYLHAIDNYMQSERRKKQRRPGSQ